MSVRARLAVATLALLFPVVSAAATNCDEYEDRAKRLYCYDEASGRNARERAKSTPPAPVAPSGQTAGGPMQAPPSQPEAKLTTGCNPTALAYRWSLDPCMSDPRFALRFHQPIYLIGRHSDNPNHPSTDGVVDDNRVLDAVEAKFQLSLKARLWESPARRHAFWLGYTQQSQWQVGNETQSRPFRETNYQPELIYAWRPVDFEHSGWNWGLFALAFLHESNGQSGSQSRSWNRIYAQFAFEKQFDAYRGMEVFVRPWVRVREEPASDENPDITDYLGHGDVTVVLRNCGHTLTLMGRGNVRTRKGAFQATWSSPPLGNMPLRIYGQFFTGYGESLIDYNWRQTTVGMGIALNDVVDDPPGQPRCS